MIAASIFAILTGDVTVSSMLGTRVYHSWAPARCDRPYAVVKILGGTNDETLDGHDGLMDGLFQVDCIDDTQDDAFLLAEATRPALGDYVGTIGGHEIKRVKFDHELDTSELEQQGGEDIIGRVTQTWGVWYCEPNI